MKDKEKTNNPKFEFTSMRSLQGSIGFPVALAKLCKDAGCSAFKPSGRIDAAELIRFYFAQQDKLAAGVEKLPSGVLSWRDALNKAQSKREEIRLAKERGEVIQFTDAHRQIAECMEFLFNELDRMKHEWPPALKGLGETSVYKIVDREIEKLRDILKERFDEVGKKYPSDGQALVA
jgi:hypothetical protein